MPRTDSDEMLDLADAAGILTLIRHQLRLHNVSASFASVGANLRGVLALQLGASPDRIAQLGAVAAALGLDERRVYGTHPRLVELSGKFAGWTVEVYTAAPTCPYTFSHTRHWCGNDECREH